MMPSFTTVDIEMHYALLQHKIHAMSGTYFAEHHAFRNWNFRKLNAEVKLNFEIHSDLSVEINDFHQIKGPDKDPSLGWVNDRHFLKFYTRCLSKVYSKKAK